MTVDTKLSNQSLNPIANSVVKKALDRKASLIDLNNKLNAATFALHNKNEDIHVTREEKNKWNSLNKVVVEENLSETKNPVSSIAIKRALENKAEKDTTEKHIKNEDIHVTKEWKDKVNSLIVKDSLLEGDLKENFSELAKKITNYSFLVITYHEDNTISSTTVKVLDSLYGKFIELKIGTNIAKVRITENNDKTKDIIDYSGDGSIIVTDITGFGFNIE